jgi:hypothetical protein
MKLRRSDFRPTWTLYWISILFWLTPAVLAAPLSASIDRDLIGENDSLRLLVTLEGGGDGQELDLSPLQKDFDVLSNQQSSRLQIINGRMDSSKQWAIVLAPKRTGELTIPPLGLGKLRTEALTVQVRKASRSDKSGSALDVLLEAELDTTSVYVQAQVILTLRLLHSVALREGTLSKPEIGDAIVERLGDDRSYTTQRKGKRYEVIERRYALFPQRSGTLTIAAVTFTGKAPDSRAQQGGGGPFNDPFGDPFNLLQPLVAVRARSPELTVDVKARPAPVTATEPWLPARQLQLSESWSPEPPTFRVGEPVTRTLVLAAAGLTAAQLAVPELPALEGAKLYADQPTRRDDIGADGVSGTTEVKWAIVPSRTGTLTLPQIDVPWWNTQTQRREIASLPARQIKVMPATIASPQPAAGTAATPAASNNSLAAAAQEGADPWRQATVAAVVAWLVTLALWLRARKGPVPRLSPEPATAAAPTRRIAPAKRALEEACATADPALARDRLLALAAALWPDNPPRTLTAISARWDGAARDAVLRLDAALYGANRRGWSATDFLKAIGPALKAGSAATSAAPTPEPLAPLYPPAADNAATATTRL